MNPEKRILRRAGRPAQTLAVLSLAAACGEPQKPAVPEPQEEVSVKGAFDDYDGDAGDGRGAASGRAAGG